MNIYICTSQHISELKNAFNHQDIMLVVNDHLPNVTVKTPQIHFVSTEDYATAQRIIDGYLKIYKPEKIFSSILLPHLIEHPIIYIHHQKEILPNWRTLTQLRGYQDQNEIKFLNLYPLLQFTHTQESPVSNSTFNLLNTLFRYGSYKLAQHTQATWHPKTLKQRKQKVSIEGFDGSKLYDLFKVTSDTLSETLLFIQNKRMTHPCIISDTTFLETIDTTRFPSDSIFISLAQVEYCLATLMNSVKAVYSSKFEFDLSIWSSVFKKHYFQYTENAMQILSEQKAEETYGQMISLAAESAEVTVNRSPCIKVRRTCVSAENVEVSVIVCCYNYGNFLYEAVESIVHQTFQRFEIIIVDDGSNDNTPKICTDILHEFSHHAICIVQQPNSGEPAISRNHGISLAQGENIICLDADDKLSENYLEACLDILQQNEEISIAYPNVQEFGASHNQWNGIPDYDPYLLFHWNYMSVASMFKKQAWVDVGGYSPGIRGHEDWDFWIACAEKNHFGKKASPATHFYRVHTQSLLTQTGNIPHKRNQLKAQLINSHFRLYHHEQQNWAYRVLFDQELVRHPNENPSIIPFMSKSHKTADARQIQRQYQETLHKQLQYQALKATRHLENINHLYWAKKNETWMSSDKETATILDWHPLNPLTSISASEVWAPTETAKDLLAKVTPLKINIRVVPRFYIDQKMTLTNYDLEKAHAILIFLDENHLWKILVESFLNQYQIQDDVVMVIVPPTSQMETCVEYLSELIDNLTIDSEQMADITVFDIEEAERGNLVRELSPILVFCNALQDSSGIIWTTALAQRLHLLSEEASTSHLNYTKETENPAPILQPWLEDLTHQLEKKLTLLTAAPDFVKKWNQNAYKAMTENI